MKAFICSDIHTEFYPPGYHHKKIFNSFPKTEAIIIAGDLTTKNYLESNLGYLCKRYKEVIYIPGNHEYYGSTLFEIHEILNSIPYKNFQWLNINNSFNNIYGTTLWFSD